MSTHTSDENPTLVLGEPLLKVSELHGSWLLQRTRDKSANPIVVNAECRSYRPVLPHPLFYRLPGLLNALFYRHAC